MYKVSSATTKESDMTHEYGKRAELEVFGVRRGGVIYDGVFYYCARGMWKVENASSINTIGREAVCR